MTTTSHQPEEPRPRRAPRRVRTAERRRAIEAAAQSYQRQQAAADAEWVTRARRVLQSWNGLVWKAGLALVSLLVGFVIVEIAILRHGTHYVASGLRVSSGKHDQSPLGLLTMQRWDPSNPLESASPPSHSDTTQEKDSLTLTRDQIIGKCPVFSPEAKDFMIQPMDSAWQGGFSFSTVQAELVHSCPSKSPFDFDLKLKGVFTSRTLLSRKTGTPPASPLPSELLTTVFMQPGTTFTRATLSHLMKRAHDSEYQSVNPQGIATPKFGNEELGNPVRSQVGTALSPILMNPLIHYGASPRLSNAASSHSIHAQKARHCRTSVMSDLLRSLRSLREEGAHDQGEDKAGRSIAHDPLEPFMGVPIIQGERARVLLQAALDRGYVRVPRWYKLVTNNCYGDAVYKVHFVNHPLGWVQTLSAMESESVLQFPLLLCKEDLPKQTHPSSTRVDLDDSNDHEPLGESEREKLKRMAHLPCSEYVDLPLSELALAVKGLTITHSSNHDGYHEEGSKRATAPQAPTTVEELSSLYSKYLIALQDVLAIVTHTQQPEPSALPVDPRRDPTRPFMSELHAPEDRPLVTRTSRLLFGKASIERPIGVLRGCDWLHLYDRLHLDESAAQAEAEAHRVHRNTATIESVESNNPMLHIRLPAISVRNTETRQYYRDFSSSQDSKQESSFERFKRLLSDVPRLFSYSADKNMRDIELMEVEEELTEEIVESMSGKRAGSSWWVHLDPMKNSAAAGGVNRLLSFGPYSSTKMGTSDVPESVAFGDPARMRLDIRSYAPLLPLIATQRRLAISSLKEMYRGLALSLQATASKGPSTFYAEALGAELERKQIPDPALYPDAFVLKVDDLVHDQCNAVVESLALVIVAIASCLAALMLFLCCHCFQCPARIRALLRGEHFEELNGSQLGGYALSSVYEDGLDAHGLAWREERQHQRDRKLRAKQAQREQRRSQPKTSLASQLPVAEVATTATDTSANEFSSTAP